MQASKVTISPETRAKAAEPLNRSERQKLQREQIMAYIRSKPVGTRINVRKMGITIGLSQSRLLGLPLFLRTMEQAGLITMDPRDQRAEHRVFTVKADVVTSPAVREPETSHEVVKPSTAPEPGKTLGEYAKEFAWSKNSDSLREFVAYMDGIELDIRRQIQGGF